MYGDGDSYLGKYVDTVSCFASKAAKSVSELISFLVSGSCFPDFIWLSFWTLVPGSFSEIQFSSLSPQQFTSPSGNSPSQEIHCKILLSPLQAKLLTLLWLLSYGKYGSCFSLQKHLRQISFQIRGSGHNRNCMQSLCRLQCQLISTSKMSG